jgi:hypothetical protein
VALVLADGVIVPDSSPTGGPYDLLATGSGGRSQDVDFRRGRVTRGGSPHDVAVLVVLGVGALKTSDPNPWVPASHAWRRHVSPKLSSTQRSVE